FSNTGGTVTRINDVVPESELVEKPFNITDVFAFFGRELDLQTFQNQWREMFLTKRPVRVSVKGIEYRVGDGVSWMKKPATVPMGSRFLIKQARINVTNETTELRILEEKIPKPTISPS
ncbi:MAG: hypothetical protein L0Y80_12080, partial [Ignavibacteriae bacterium]|nr:hypothetical protein [Ignavibacteriota bacterium]